MSLFAFGVPASSSAIYHICCFLSGALLYGILLNLHSRYGTHDMNVFVAMEVVLRSYQGTRRSWQDVI